jgi:[acyl-carrier-protein] S-malonyltransferase
MMKKNFEKIAYIFPGQGAQYPGMAKDFVDNFSAARLTFEEADDLLRFRLSEIVLNGPEQTLKETKNSQLGIYVTSMAIFRVVQELHGFQPYVCAGLSLGEYTALTAGGWLSFMKTLPLVQHRGQFMNDACESTEGTMVVVMGLENAIVEKIVDEVNLPHDLWIANYNCPGQIVLSGTLFGINAATEVAKKYQAKRVLPLQVYGAFHSGLMKSAQDKLTPYIQETHFDQGTSTLVMNVPGDFVSDLSQLKTNLIQQVTHSVRWEQGVQAMMRENIDLFIEFGPGTTLSGMNKRIGVTAPTLSIEKIADLDRLTQLEKRDGFHEK